MQVSLHLIYSEKLSCRKQTVRLLCVSVLAKCNWQMIFCRHYGYLFNQCDAIDLQSYQIRWNNT